MATAKQSAASRANSLKSTGPRSTAGKAICRFNAMKHGVFATSLLMFDETAEHHASITAEYHEQYSPANAAGHLLVETLIGNEWRLRRLRRIAAQQWMDASFHFIALNLDTTITSTSGQAFATESSTFERLQRVVNSCERAYHRAFKDLAVARGAPSAVSEPTQPQYSTPSYTFPASFRQNPQNSSANPFRATSAPPGLRVEKPPTQLPPRVRTPATPTFHTQFRVRSFVPSNSAKPVRISFPGDLRPSASKNHLRNSPSPANSPQPQHFTTSSATSAPFRQLRPKNLRRP